MLTQDNVDARMSTLLSTTSDLLVGLQCFDAPEVERMARRLEKWANVFGVPQVGQTAHKIEQSAVAGNLAAAQRFIVELNEQLQHAPLLMRQTNREDTQC